MNIRARLRAFTVLMDRLAARRDKARKRKDRPYAERLSQRMVKVSRLRDELEGRSFR
jgi:hypothetical protein